ncbi:NYN domain-containing protein, partial [Variovorax sp. CT11-76]
MTPTLCVMLLIDADNVSADVIEQAVQRTMDEYGAIHVRRAYCNAEMAVNRQALFKRLSVRPMVNLSAGKNSTDIALSVDAIDLAIAERPDVVVLVSSDSDFAPLVIRLREKGCRVCGIGQQGKTGEETVGIYDSFMDLAHHGVAPAARTVPARKTAAKKAAAKTAPAKKAPAKKAAAKTAKKTAAKKVAKAAAPAR